ncbi:microfibrillar-associated protein 1-like [Physella acuta]|uniref:microfibrillar-associated protein 1-like n=1 Tax=Physella acuta TaxID=109671 RepID=UPI0027DE32AE|nr:microfibrillar-associated protein 1-like [Physella acuta]XP_059152742.1 microfibrillar-associated protein 1-like [Physella acuta]XP_059152743.1 microfibrillar-associated protein 1-like [Physella acuta]
MSKAKVPIMSTAGAIPVRNEKGELTMEKVKVTRYMRGQRPEFAPESDDEEEIEVTTGFQSRVRPQVEEKKDEEEVEKESQEVHDRRLRRLQQRHQSDEDDDEEDDEDRVTRHRREVVEPEVIAEGSDDEGRPVRRRRADDSSEGEEDDEEEEELDEEEIEKRRALRRLKVIQQRDEEEVMDVEDEKKDEEDESEEESSEYEEYTDSEEEAGPRLKPVFVRKKDRITVQEREREEVRAKELEAEAKRLAEERKRQTIKMANQDMKREMDEEKSLQQACDGIDSDDENDEEEYELWKVRELKRIKRDREEREAIDKEKMEVERLRNMTEEERRQELRQNPKQVTNKAPKGKYKFLQKYYHRGAFFLDNEDTVFKQDFSQPTLEDHFDKTILPKVMQVKNFGRSGRTKYTHLLDQDTTQHEAPWMQDTAQNLKFHTARGGGMKQQFERPSTKVKK